MSEVPASAVPPVGCVVDLGERVRLMPDGLVNRSNLLISAPAGIILVPILLVGELRGPEMYERSWLGKRPLLGGKWILEFIASDPALKKIGEYNLDPWMHTLFRKN